MGRWRRNGSIIGALAASLALALSTGVSAQGSEEAGITACVTSEQELLKVAFGGSPASPCSDDEVEVHWIVQRAASEPVDFDDLVSGATIEGRELSPGVIHVVNDGQRDLRRNEDVVAGRDGSVWVFRQGEFFEVGAADSHAWSNDLYDTGQDSSEDIEVGPDGTIWWADADGEGLKSFDGAGWTVRRPAGRGEGARVDQVEVTTDGTVYASWWSGRSGSEARRVARLDESGWTVIRGFPASEEARLGVGDDGSISLFLRTPRGSQRVYRGDAAAGIALIERPLGQVIYADTGDDGTMWMHVQRDPRECGADRCAVAEPQILARYDGAGWTEYPLAPELGGIGGLMAAPDGSVWSATCDSFASGCELLRFDGETWDGFLGEEGYGDIDEIAFAEDGTVWSISGPNDLFVVRPEALTSSG